MVNDENIRRLLVAMNEVSLFGFQGVGKCASTFSLREKGVKFSLYTFFFKRKYAPLAQLVEQLTLNQWVPGSNP